MNANADEFVKRWKAEKDNLLKIYFETDSRTAVTAYFKAMHLSKDQEELLRKAVDQLLTDTFYNLLLGLDGSASIGGSQETYKIYDESNHLISDCGELESAAYEHFQEV